jgi:hypothetical protein
MTRKTPDGGRKPRVTDADLLDVFRATDDPVLSTAEVADAVPIKRRGTLDRLRSLEADGELDSKPVGGRNTVWWIADAQNTAATQPSRDGRESVETPAKAQADEWDEDTDDTHETPVSGDEHDALSDVVEEVADGWEDNPDRIAARKRAALAVLAYAQEHGSVSKREAKEEVEPNHPVENQQPDTWYRKNIRPVLNEAAQYDQSARAYTLTVEGSND